jgi:hypothetical protein
VARAVQPLINGAKISTRLLFPTTVSCTIQFAPGAAAARFPPRSGVKTNSADTHANIAAAAAAATPIAVKAVITRAVHQSDLSIARSIVAFCVEFPSPEGQLITAVA